MSATKDKNPRQYEYKSIYHENEIRILILQPATEVQDDLQATIVHVNYPTKDDAAVNVSPWSAVSYAWGVEPPSMPLYIHTADSSDLTSESTLIKLRPLWATHHFMGLFQQGIETIYQFHRDDVNFHPRIIDEPSALAMHTLLKLQERAGYHLDLLWGLHASVCTEKHDIINATLALRNRKEEIGANLLSTHSTRMISSSDCDPISLGAFTTLLQPCPTTMNLGTFSLQK